MDTFKAIMANQAILFAVAMFIGFILSVVVLEKTKLLEAFKESGDSKQSYSRSTGFIIVVVNLFAMVIVAIKKGELVDIQLNWAGLVGALYGFNTWRERLKKKAIPEPEPETLPAAKKIPEPVT